MPYNTLKKGIDWNYESYHEYLSLLESKNLALNICSYIGHSALRIFTMGEEAMQREAREEEIIEMELRSNVNRPPEHDNRDVELSLEDGISYL